VPPLILLWCSSVSPLMASRGGGGGGRRGDVDRSPFFSSVWWRFVSLPFSSRWGCGGASTLFGRCGGVSCEACSCLRLPAEEDFIEGASLWWLIGGVATASALCDGVLLLSTPSGVSAAVVLQAVLRASSTFWRWRKMKTWT
jgi:hypothetical protein